MLAKTMAVQEIKHNAGIYAKTQAMKMGNASRHGLLAEESIAGVAHRSK